MMNEVSIVGGGLGGLTLARILQKHGVPAVVYEREATPNERSQGGSLDIHLESGQFALREAGLLDGFHRLARPEDQEMKIFDPSGRVWWEDAGIDERSGRPEIDRGLLRKLLLDSLAPDTVRWGHQVRQADQIDEGKYRLEFKNGESAQTSFLVGADGAWSRIRPLLSAEQPVYTGVTLVEMNLPNIDAGHPDLALLVGHGKMFALGDEKGILAQRNGDSQVRVGAALRVPLSWPEEVGITADHPSESLEVLLRQFDGWSPGFRALLQRVDPEMRIWNLHALPTGHRWAHRPGITLLGDAAHLMSPFAGEGANLAMQDAAELALALKTGQEIEIVSYESTMFDRAQIAAHVSDFNLKLALHPEGARLLSEQMANYK